MSNRILIADDEPSVRQLLELVLRNQGYEVLIAHNGDQLVRAAQEYVPDLVIVDLMMPAMDGYEAIRQLRNDTRTAHLPMVILTAKTAPDDVVTGFETGADDYITKPFNIPELLARIKGHLRRASAQPVRSPLTGLPGNILLTEEIKYRLRSASSFAILYIDLDNFKAFNDTYGPARGDRVIRLVADLLNEVVQKYGTGTDFIGHIGGDDFAVLTSPDMVHDLCVNLLGTFDERVRGLYDETDLERGYLLGVDRQGVPRRFPIISISIGVVTNRHRQFTDVEEISRVAAEMKQFAKQQPGSAYAIDGRSTSNQPVLEERRGSHVAAVMVVSADPTLRRMLQQALMAEGYRTLEAPGVPEAHVLLTYELKIALVIVDRSAGDAVWEFVESLQEPSPPIPFILISRDQADEAPGKEHGAVAFIRQPVQIQQVLSLAAQVILHEHE